MKTALANTLIALIALNVISINTYAGSWSGDGRVGYNSVSGNSNDKSLSLGLDAAYKSGNWLYSGEADAYRSSESGREKARSYSIKLQSDFGLDETAFAFGNVRYLDDRYSGYKYQASLSLGAGRTFFSSGNNKFNGQIGFGYTANEPSNAQQQVENEPVGTAKIIYSQDLTDTTVLKTKWSAETGSDNTYLETSIALLVAMTDALGIKLAYIAKHNTGAPAGNRNTDRYTNFSLNYKFK